MVQMAATFVNNSDFTSDPTEAVMTIRTARKGVVRAVAIVATVIVAGIVVLTVLSAAGHVPAWVQLALIVVWLGFCALAATECHDALQQLRGLPAYQALHRERARLRFFLGALTARCGGGRALLWQGADGRRAAKVWLARTASGAPAGLRVLVLDGGKLIKYQICRFGAEFIICQVYNFDTTAAAAAFRRGIVDGHSVAEVFGEDNPSVLASLNGILQKLTSQEVIQVEPPVSGEFPTHTV